MFLLDIDPSQDWIVRHGRCCALGVALKENANKVTSLGLRSNLVQTASQLAGADKVHSLLDITFPERICIINSSSKI